MFEDLTIKLNEALKGLKGQDKISELNIESAIRSVRRALLEADVSLEIVNDFINEVKLEALGKEVVRGITPDQKFIEIIHKKLTHIMGDRNEKLDESTKGLTVIMLVGLQGAGKTTIAAKLALYLKENGRRVLLIAADTFRPAAKKQLETLGEQIKIPVFSGAPGETSLETATNGKKKAIQENYEIAIVDTAGRLYIDNELMNEAAELKTALQPSETLLVVDSMIGQEGAELTRIFNDRVGITGAILTKLDGDSRGGAALSIRKISGKPIKFIGNGEKVDALEPFYPDRIANRILGMGDILTLVDKAQKEVELTDVVRMQQKFQEATFDFTDFLQQMKLIKRMGSLGGLIKLLPGMNKIDDKMLRHGETQLRRIQSMIDSMSSAERKDPKLLLKSPQRRRRIATGSGHSISEVDRMITDFERMRNMMQGIAKGDFSRFTENSNRNELATGAAPRERSTKSPGEKKKEMRRKKGFSDL